MSNKNPIIFRVDCKSPRAQDSLERCLILAETHARRGGGVHFAIDQSAQGAREILAAQGLSEITITAPSGSDEDCAQVLCAATTLGASAVVIDGIGFGTPYLTELAASIYTAVILDGDERVLPVQLVINASCSADERFYTCRADTKLLLGPQYQMVRPEISDWPKPERPSGDADTQRIFVATGDDHHTARLLDCMPAPKKATILSVQGSQDCPILNAAARSACARGYIVEELSPSCVSDALLFSDAAISSAESYPALRAFYGIPSLTLSIRPEHNREVHRLAEEGANLHTPPMNEMDNQEIEACIHDFLRDERGRERMGKRLSALMDGLGAERVLDCIAAPQKPSIQVLEAA